MNEKFRPNLNGYTIDHDRARKFRDDGKLLTIRLEQAAYAISNVFIVIMIPGNRLITKSHFLQCRKLLLMPGCLVQNRS
jgi:hypothetical protein